MSDSEFIQRLINRYNKINKTGDLSIACVFPTHRAAYYFNDRLKSEIISTRWYPDVFSFHDFILRHSSLNPAPMPELIFQLYSVYRDRVRSREIKFEHFYTWGKMILSDFGEADKQMVDIDMMFQHLMEFGEVESLHDDDQTDIYRRYVGFWGELGSLYHGFRSRLKPAGKAYDGMIFREVAESIGEEKNSQWDRVLFCGLNALSKSEKIIIKNYLDQSAGEMYWDMDRYFTEDESQEAGFFYRENLAYFGTGSMSGWVGNSLDQPKNIQVRSVPSDAGQAKVLGELLKEVEILETGIEKTAIVLPDESLLFPVLNSIPRSIKKINVTMGYPLKHSSLFNLFSLILELHENVTSEGFYYQNVFDLLRHPYVKLILKEEGEKWIREIQKRNEIHVRDIPRLAPELRKIFSEISDSSSALSLFLDLLYYMRDFHESAGEDGGLFPMDLEFIHHFYLLLNQMKEAVEGFNVKTELSSFWSLFSDIVSDSRIPFTGEPLEGIQVMGMLETQGLNFKRVIVLSVNEGVLPAGKTGQSLIPYDIRKMVGLPTYHHRDAVSAYHFFRLIKDASEVHLIYNSRIKGIQKREKSRFIDQLMYEWDIRDNKRDILQQGYSFEIGSAESRPIAVEKSSRVMDRVKKMTYSATSLLTYLTCSLKFYLTYVLRIRESEEIVESPDDRLLGTIVHDILHRCYSPYIGKTVTDEILNRMGNESFYDPLILEVMKKKLGISDVQTGRNRVVFEVIKDFLNHFFRYEQNNSGFSIRGLEKCIDGLDFKMMHDESELNVKLKGTIDRWDEMDGISRIIDYKTGDIKSQNIQSFEVFRGIKVVDRRSAFQLFFYGLLLQKHQPLYPVSRLGVFSLRKPDDPLNFVSIEKRQDLTENDFRDFEAFLMEVFQEIFDPSVTFSQTPHEILCRNCPFQSQCDRIQPDFD